MGMRDRKVVERSWVLVRALQIIVSNEYFTYLLGMSIPLVKLKPTSSRAAFS